MDNIKIITLYDEETDTERRFELANIGEIDGTTYMLVAELPEENGELPPEWNDDDDDEEESNAYLFRLCEREEAEFVAIDGEYEQYITSVMTDEEYDKAAAFFMESEDYDLSVDGEEV